MNILATIAISAIATLASAFGLYNYLPLSFIEQQKEANLGATITTINGSDTLSSSRAVINNNFTNLNNDKIEATQTTMNSLTSATSLASLPALSTVGTITSGTWNGSTVTVPWGGTGSTTLASNQILLGNGTGNVSVVSGLGTSGQFLTSNGAGNAPAWSTGGVNTASDYTWTGAHTFNTATTTLNATTTIAASTNSPVILNSVSYKFPTTQNSRASLVNDGSGNLSWGGGGIVIASSTATVDTSGTSATSTLASFSVPANILSTGNILETTIPIQQIGATVTTQHATICISYGASLWCSLRTLSGAVATFNGEMKVTLMGNAATNSQRMILSFIGGASNSNTDSWVEYKATTFTTDSTSAQTLAITFASSNADGNSGSISNGYYSILYR